MIFCFIVCTDGQFFALGILVKWTFWDEKSQYFDINVNNSKLKCNYSLYNFTIKDKKGKGIFEKDFWTIMFDINILLNDKSDKCLEKYHLKCDQ